MVDGSAKNGQWVEDSEQRAAKRNILVLGSVAHPSAVTAYTWDTVPPKLNVADYDVVILNFAPFLDDEPQAELPLDNLPDRDQFIRLMFSEGSEIIAIGVPTSKILIDPASIRNWGIPLPPTTSIQTTHAEPKPRYEKVTWWLPREPVCTFDGGERIDVVDPAFAFYFQQLRRWEFHITGLRSSDARWFGVGNLASELRPIAKTRFDQPIACNIQFQEVQEEKTRGVVKTNVVAESGPVIWLPLPTEVSAEDAINLILRERYGVRPERIAPSWVAAYQLPAEEPIQAEMTRIREDIRQLEIRFAAAEQQLQSEARFRKLLYEQGEDALEPVVRDALRALGAQVADPVRRGIEDGTMVDPAGRPGLLEIKGRTGPLKFEDVRQLDFWVRSKVAEEENELPKGILIANLACRQAPGERGVVFPDNCVKAARRLDICLMTTTQLFHALRRHQLAQLDVGSFWDTVYTTKGICPLPDLTPSDKG